MDFFDVLLAKKLSGGGGSSTTIEELNVTSNGTYTAPEGTAYSPVNVNVSGGGGVEEKDVNFYDYDGTLLYSYTAQQFANLTEMPRNPDHTDEGLTADGWNWDLPNAKSQVATTGFLQIGQTYHPTNGSTRLYMNIPYSMTITLPLKATTGTNITVNWGDNNSETKTTSNNLAEFSHDYILGHYVIEIQSTRTISVRSVSHNIFGSTGSGQVSKNQYMALCVERIDIGTNWALTKTDFDYCSNTKILNIPYGLTTFPDSWLNNLEYGLGNASGSLKQLIFPKNTTSIGTNTLSNKRALKILCLPQGLVTLSSAISSCYQLEILSIPTTVQTGSQLSTVPLLKRFNWDLPITGSFLTYDTQITRYDIKQGITSIPSYTLDNCLNLEYVSIPNSVTSIQRPVGQSCVRLKEVHIYATTPPSLSGSGIVFSNSPHVVIYVPSASLTTYQNDANWSTYADKMVGE